MNVGLYATKIQATVMKDRQEFESAYDKYPDAMRFWCFIDLVGSSNFRISHGPKDGYVRGETFFSLTDAAIRPYADLTLIKEVGDAVLLCSPNFRPLLECVLLVDQAAHQLADVAGSKDYPFSVRAGIDFGPAKRLTRRHEDYLGHPIDRLARIMGVRSTASNLLLGEDAHRSSQEVLAEYRGVLSVGDPTILPAEKSKGMLHPVYYRELLVDRKELVEFREHFVPWR